MTFGDFATGGRCGGVVEAPRRRENHHNPTHHVPPPVTPRKTVHHQKVVNTLPCSLLFFTFSSPALRPLSTVPLFTAQRDSNHGEQKLPLFGVQSRETNQHHRFFFACGCAFFTTNAAKIKKSMPQLRRLEIPTPSMSCSELGFDPAVDASIEQVERESASG